MNNCPNCGEKVNQVEFFCRTCGSKLNFNVQNTSALNNQSNNFQNMNNMNNQNINGIQNNNLQNMNNQNFNNTINDDDYLIDSYIGKNADKLKDGKFCVNTFLFGFVYALYRKMWLLGFSWLAAAYILNIFLSSFSSFIMIVFGIVISIEFKKLYLKNVREQVNKIKENNKDKSLQELANICRKKGGTTVVPVIIFVVFYVIIIALLTFSTVLISSNKTGTSKNDTNSNKSQKNINDNKYYNLELKIPEGFESEPYNSNNYRTYYAIELDNYFCSIDIKSDKSTNDFSDAKKYLENNAYYSEEDKYSGITEKNINNKTWYFASVEYNNSIHYYYSISDNKRLYIIDYWINDDTNKKCSSMHDEFINSLKVK